MKRLSNKQLAIISSSLYIRKLNELKYNDIDTLNEIKELENIFNNYNNSFYYSDEEK